MMKNAIVILASLAALTSCRGSSKSGNAAETGAPPPPPPAPATPSEPPAPTGPVDPKPELPMIGKTPVTHFRVLDVKKFKQIGTKGYGKGSNPDFYAVKGKLLAHSAMLKEIGRGATACFSHVKDREVRKGETLPITSTLAKRGEGDSKDFFFANIASATREENGIVVICMKRGEITGLGFRDALKGIVEIIKK